MSIVDCRLFEQQQQLEDNRRGVAVGGGREFEKEEEDPKRQKVDVVIYRDFHEYDSDDTNDDDFSSSIKCIEVGVGDSNPLLLYPFEKEKGRICHKVGICNKHQHEKRFNGKSLFELLKVKLINLNGDPSSLPSCKLYGNIEVASSNENPEPISYYSVRKENAVDISSLISPVNNKIINLNLSGPRSGLPIALFDLVILDFAFKFGDKDVFGSNFHENADELLVDGNLKPTSSKCIVLNPFDMGSRRNNCEINRQLVLSDSKDTDIFRVAAYYAVYMGAWATVDVKILKKDVSSVYGFIYARPCIFKSRIRLLYIQSDQKRKLQASEAVELTRSIVAVPSYSSLIIAAELYDQDNNQIVRAKTFFPALRDGRVTKRLSHDDTIGVICQDGDGIEVLSQDGNGIEVTVSWRC